MDVLKHSGQVDDAPILVTPIERAVAGETRVAEGDKKTIDRLTRISGYNSRVEKQMDMPA
jgi:hypothetical protein